MKTLIQNCRIVSPGVDLPRGGIVMENGMITAVGEIPEQESFDSVIDGTAFFHGYIHIKSKRDAVLKDKKPANDFCTSRLTWTGAKDCRKCGGRSP